MIFNLTITIEKISTIDRIKNGQNEYILMVTKTKQIYFTSPNDFAN